MESTGLVWSVSYVIGSALFLLGLVLATRAGYHRKEESTVQPGLNWTFHPLSYRDYNARGRRLHFTGYILVIPGLATAIIRLVSWV